MSEEQQPPGGETDAPGGARPGAPGPEEASAASGPGGTGPGAGRSGGAARKEPGDRWERWGPDATGATATGATATGATATGAADGATADGVTSRRLVRDKQHKVVGGVCAGLGRYFELDPVLFRVPLGVLSVVSGIGLIFYGFAWLFIPAGGERENELRRLMSGRVEGSSLSAVLVALVGCGLFLASMGTRSTPFSVLLIGAVAGAAYWSQHRRRSEADAAAGLPADPATAHAVADAPPEAQAPPVPSAPSWWRDPLAKGDTPSGAPGPAAGQGTHPGFAGHTGPTGYLWGPDEGSPDAERAARASRAAWPGLADAGPAPGEGPGPGGGERRRREGRSIGGPVFLLAVLAAVTGTAATWGSEGLGASLTVGFSCALAVFGIGLVVSAFRGRIGFGTILSVVLTAVLLAGAAVVPDGIGTRWQARTWTPASVSQTRDHYRLDTGRAELDLRRLRLEDGQTVHTRVELGAGELKVVVPRTADVRVNARAGLGDIRVPVRTDDEGLVVFSSVSGTDQRMRTGLKPFGGGNPRGTVDLRVAVDVGRIEVVRQLPSGERSDGTARTAGTGRAATGTTGTVGTAGTTPEEAVR